MVDVCGLSCRVVGLHLWSVVGVLALVSGTVVVIWCWCFCGGFW